MNPRNRLATPYSCCAFQYPQNPETSRHRRRGTWLFTLAVWAGLAVGLNGAAGYVPTRTSYAEGGYEVQSSPFAPGAGEQLIEAALQGLRDLQ